MAVTEAESWDRDTNVRQFQKQRSRPARVGEPVREVQGQSSEGTDRPAVLPGRGPACAPEHGPAGTSAVDSGLAGGFLGRGPPDAAGPPSAVQAWNVVPFWHLWVVWCRI